eukprot:15463430-Alexandrium_andersonii.AAC.1
MGPHLAPQQARRPSGRVPMTTKAQPPTTPLVPEDRPCSAPPIQIDVEMPALVRRRMGYKVEGKTSVLMHADEPEIPGRDKPSICGTVALLTNTACTCIPWQVQYWGLVEALRDEEGGTASLPTSSRA